VKKTRSRIARAAAVIVALLLLPGVALANPFSMDWSILGFDPTPPQYWNAYIDGSNIFYNVSTGAPLIPLWRYDLTTGTHHSLPPTAGANAWGVVGAGDWVAWIDNWNITVMNLKTGAIKHVTNEPDFHFDQDSNVDISDADGAYVVWQWQQDISVTAIKGKNLGMNGAVFTLVGSSSNPKSPSIYGKRVAYEAHWNGADNVWVKTIGSSAPPSRISSCGGDVSLMQQSANIGDHLVVWNEFSNQGGVTMHYYDFYTRETHELHLGGGLFYRLSVSGDRILYLMMTGPDTTEARVFDTRVAKSTPELASVEVSTEDSVHDGTIDGNRIAFVDAGTRGMHFATLMVPTISLHSVPSRIPHGGHIHLTGYISDQGRRIGSAIMGIEKYASGKWIRVKTFTATSTGDFTYKTPKTYSKTKYRVVYDGYMSATAAPARNHLSTVSAVKTAWPR
jgi:hypothetical protein